MNCEQVAPYLPGVAGNELGDESLRWVDAHLATCPSCRADAARYRSVSSGLVALREHDPAPPAYLADAIVEHVRAESNRRYLPVSPMIPAELVRLVQDNRDAIASAAGVALAAGAAFALWRRMRSPRTPLAT
jgi:anti-sigma factor RsiW